MAGNGVTARMERDKGVNAMASKEYEFHPVANIFPMMEGAAYAELVADIKEHGLRDSILIAEGKIADGRNRYQACIEAEVEPRFEQWDKKGSLAKLVVSRNAHRRHMDRSQLAMAAAKAIPFFEAEAAERQKNGTLVSGDTKGRAREKAAESVGASPASVARAKTVIDKGTPELVQAVEAGKVTVSDAAAIVDEPKAEQRKAVKAVQDGKAKTVKAAVQKPKTGRGEPKIDVRKFEKAKANVGKLVREMSDLKEHAGGASFHETIRKGFNEILTTLDAWRKAVLK